MANLIKKPEDRKNSITLSITNKIHVEFREVTVKRKLNWSHEVEKFMKSYIKKYS